MSGASDMARLGVRREPNGWLRLELAGNWLARAGLPGLEAVEREAAAGPTPGLAFDATGLSRWNSGLVVFVAKCHALCQARHIEFHAETLPPGVAKLIALAQAVPERKGAARQSTPSSLAQRLGETVLGFQAEALGMVTFLGESVLALLGLARGRTRMRWADVLLVMQDCGPRALGIVALINFLIGLILAFVGVTGLATFGAALYVADLVGVATVREMGCIMTAIIMCGRTGAAFAAQLGTMKVSQEIEALTTLGLSPMEFLVLPRMLALAVMMPVLCLFADLIAIAGGFLISTLMLHIDPGLYLHRTAAAITLPAFLLGVFKGSVFGVVVALTGCLRGMQCGTNAAAVGKATTSAVVTGITAIIALDGLFAVLCYALKI